MMELKPFWGKKLKPPKRCFSCLLSFWRSPGPAKKGLAFTSGEIAKHNMHHRKCSKWTVQNRCWIDF